MKRRPMCLLKKKKRRKTKTKRKRNEKEKKKKKKKIATLFLETQARSEGYMAKVFKSCALNQLVRSHRLSAHYMGG